jgi:hypothetical protein
MGNFELGLMGEPKLIGVSKPGADNFAVDSFPASVESWLGWGLAQNVNEIDRPFGNSGDLGGGNSK